MASILFDQAALSVSEDVDEVLTRVVNSRDGLRRGNGSILAPAGWIVLSESDTGEPIYVQVSRVGYVRAD
jgi:hypothetical protein